MPQQTSSTRLPGASPASSTVRVPQWSQKNSGASSKCLAAALKVARIRAFTTPGLGCAGDIRGG